MPHHQATPPTLTDSLPPTSVLCLLILLDIICGLDRNHPEMPPPEELARQEIDAECDELTAIFVTILKRSKQP